jgi:hypothetical protein
MIYLNSKSKVKPKTMPKAEREAYAQWCAKYGIKPEGKVKKKEIIYDLGFSFFPLYNANKDTPETFTTLKRQPGISPFDLPRLPKPEIKTSS